MVFLIQNIKYLSESELKKKLKEKREELAKLNGERIVLEFECKKLL